MEGGVWEGRDLATPLRPDLFYNSSNNKGCPTPITRDMGDALRPPTRDLAIASQIDGNGRQPGPAALIDVNDNDGDGDDGDAGIAA